MTGKVTNVALILFCFTFVPVFQSWAAEDVISALQKCREIKKPEQRLECFDDKARRFAPPTLSGKLGHVTEVFTLEVPHLLRYRSQGVIFVLYLRDGKGNVLQNLHVGGRGEDEYLIDTPGQYSLKIDGSAGWDIWLEPMGN